MTVLSQLTTVLQQLVVAVQQLATGTLPTGAPTSGPATSVQQARTGSGALGAPRPAGARRDAPDGADAAFNVATFNVLGASHTSTGGNQHPTWKTGAARTPAMINYLKQANVDVAGLQEFQKPQRDAFNAANTGYEMYTQGDNSIVWNAQRFRKVSADTVTIPYFEGHEVKMPVVQLEDRTTGKRAWFVDIHNPADTADHHHQAKYREEGVRREQALIAKLRETGLPVFLVGDFNDRTDAPAQITSGGAATAANAGHGHAGIDWIFGSGPVTFTRSSTDHSTQDNKVSDHPLVVATARI